MTSSRRGAQSVGAMASATRIEVSLSPEVRALSLGSRASFRYTRSSSEFGNLEHWDLFDREGSKELPNTALRSGAEERGSNRSGSFSLPTNSLRLDRSALSGAA